LKRFDYGLIGGAGIYLNLVQIEVIYNFGLTDVNVFKYLTNATKAANRVVGISVGYKFGRT
jgi:hypothetical protein